MRVTRILLVLLLITCAAATVISLVLFTVIQQDSGALEEGDFDVIGNLSITVRILEMTAITAPVVFLSCWKWIRETGLLRFLSFVLVPLLILGWVSLFFRDRADWDIWLVQSSIFLAAQMGAYLWFSSVVRGNR